MKATNPMQAGTAHKLCYGTVKGHLNWLVGISGGPTSFSVLQLEHKSAPGPDPAPDGTVSLQYALLTLWMSLINSALLLRASLRDMVRLFQFLPVMQVKRFLSGP